MPTRFFFFFFFYIMVLCFVVVGFLKEKAFNIKMLDRNETLNDN